MCHGLGLANTGLAKALGLGWASCPTPGMENKWAEAQLDDIPQEGGMDEAAPGGQG